MAKFCLWSLSIPCFRNKWEAVEYGCNFCNETKVALKELQNNHRWWNRFSNIDITWKVYIKLRSTVNLISTFFWISFYSHEMKVNFFPFTLLSICKILNYDEQKINKCYHLISKCFRFGKEGNNKLSLKGQEELECCGLKPASIMELSSFFWWHHSNIIQLILVDLFRSFSRWSIHILQ